MFYRLLSDITAYSCLAKEKHNSVCIIMRKTMRSLCACVNNTIYLYLSNIFRVQFLTQFPSQFPMSVFPGGDWNYYTDFVFMALLVYFQSIY